MLSYKTHCESSHWKMVDSAVHFDVCSTWAVKYKIDDQKPLVGDRNGPDGSCTFTGRSI
jgi:hypothetical protein